MIVHSVNIAQPQTITWKDRSYTTGIFKKPVQQPICLTKLGVKNDEVSDTKWHGGLDKAVYAYSKNHYTFWKGKYPDLDWHNGMFGENLTIEELDETSLKIGDILKTENVELQVSEPRQPCATLGARFGTQKIVKEFLNSTYCGIYFRVLKEGNITSGDRINLVSSNSNSLTIAEVYSIFSGRKNDTNLINKALNDTNLAQPCKESIARFLKKE